MLTRIMENLLNDLRYAFRSLVKRPGFTIVAILTLALGIGINTTVFSLANSVFLRQLPVASPQNLVWIFSDRYNRTSYPEYLEYQQQTELFDGVMAYEWVGLNLGSNGQSERVEGTLVSGNYFDVLGVKAALGRTFLPDEDNSPVAVINHNLWQRRFNGAANVVGKSMVLNGVQFMIVGVVPHDFVGAEEAFPRQVWIPLMMQASVRPGPAANVLSTLNNRNVRSLDVMARLKHGVTLRQAQAGMNVVASRLAQNYPESNRNFQIALYTAGNGRPAFRALLKPVTQILLGVVGLVLLITCANVANLLLARAAGRRKEVAIRLTLGATRTRLIRQLLTESILLAVASALAGLILNFWLVSLLTALKPAVPLPVNVEFHTDWRVLSFTLLLSVLAGIVFGLVPALQASKHDLVPALKDHSQQLGDRRRMFSLRNALVIGQVALSIVVLIGAGLFLRSLNHARAIDPGFDAKHILTLSFNTAAQKYDATKTEQFYQQLSNRVQALPGVQSVSLAQSAPLSYFYSPALSSPVFVEGHEPPQGADPPIVGNNTIGPNFFRTLGVPLFSGREFTDRDREGAPRVAIVNETLVRDLFPNTNPIGQRLRMLSRQPSSWEIIGVVKDSKYRTLGEDATPYIFLPYLQNPQPAMALHVRTSGNPKDLAAAVRREIQALDPNLPAFNVMSLADNIDISLFPSRFGALLLGVFGFLALLIASIGIYGVMSYGVSERTHEMGIRMALGARGSDVLRLVISQGMWLAVIGVAVGAGLALVVTRLVKSYLYDVSVTDPLTFIGIASLLIGVALLACYVPARRATKVDPLEALRYE
jgi:macrolide transport system ATP-binding/permease protein